MRRIRLFITLLVISLLVFGCGLEMDDSGVPLGSKPEPEEEVVISKTVLDDYQEIISSGGLITHFIDVGQGDAILIQLSTGQNILIDAGEEEGGEVALDYLRANGVEHIDYLIATHPHSDHIGGMKLIVENLEIKNIYMPRVIHTTKTYEDLLLAIKNQGLKINEAKAGVKLETDDIFEISFIAPNADGYEDLNDYSIVTRVKYKEHVFLFTGDAQSTSGQEILASNHDIKATVLDIPHHGSNNSLLTTEFLNRVSPRLAIISVGKDNRYGHPHLEVLEKLHKAGVEVYRTDKDGNIIIISDGNELMLNKGISTEQAVSSTGLETEMEDFIGNKRSKVFHQVTCHALPIEKNRVYFTSRQEAVEKGYKPCGQCKP